MGCNSSSQEDNQEKKEQHSLPVNEFNELDNHINNWFIKSFGDTNCLILDLSWQNLSPQHIQRIALGLKENTTLTEIDLSFNELSDESTVILAQALKQTKTLKKINLCGINIDEDGDGAIALAQVVQVNPSLVIASDIDLSFVKIPAKTPTHTAPTTIATTTDSVAHNNNSPPPPPLSSSSSLLNANTEANVDQDQEHTADDLLVSTENVRKTNEIEIGGVQVVMTDYERKDTESEAGGEETEKEKEQSPLPPPPQAKDEDEEEEEEGEQKEAKEEVEDAVNLSIPLQDWNGLEDNVKAAISAYVNK